MGISGKVVEGCGGSLVKILTPDENVKPFELLKINTR